MWVKRKIRAGIQRLGHESFCNLFTVLQAVRATPAPAPWNGPSFTANSLLALLPILPT